MFLTLQKTIELGLELWEWCAETGKCKKCWPKWEQYSMYYNDTFVDSTQAIANISILPADFAYCWYCLYSRQRKLEEGSFLDCYCSYCPLQRKFGHCSRITSYQQWFSVGSEQIKEKKMFAIKFIEDLKTITCTES